MSCLFRAKLTFAGNDGFCITPNFSKSESFCFGFSEAIAKSGQILSDTVAGWNSQPQLISKKDVIYVYVDRQQEVNDQGVVVYIPSIKIGDGRAYLIDLPFTDDLMIKHMANGDIHVTLEEKEFWNNKVTSYIDSDDEEMLVLSKL